jgi:hypothetical protein
MVPWSFPFHDLTSGGCRVAARSGRGPCRARGGPQEADSSSHRQLPSRPGAPRCRRAPSAPRPRAPWLWRPAARPTGGGEGTHYREPSGSAHFLDVPPGRLPRPVHPGSGGRLLPVVSGGFGIRTGRPDRSLLGPRRRVSRSRPARTAARWVSTRSTIPRRLRTATPRPDPTPEHSTPARADQTPWCMGPQGHRISRELQTGRAATHCREQVFIVWMGSTIGAHGVSWPVG